MGLEVRWAIAGALRELVTFYRFSLIFFKIFAFCLSDINSFSTGFSLCCEYRKEHCDPAGGQAQGRTVHGLWTLGRLRLFSVSDSKVYLFFLVNTVNVFC